MSGASEVPECMQAPELPSEPEPEFGGQALDYHEVIRAGRIATAVVRCCLQAGRGLGESNAHRAAMVEALMRPINCRRSGDEGPISASELDPRVRTLIGELDEWKLAEAYQCRVGHIRAALKRVN